MSFYRIKIKLLTKINNTTNLCLKKIETKPIQIYLIDITKVLQKKEHEIRGVKVQMSLAPFKQDTSILAGTRIYYM